jgi:hypothetical protein
MDAPKTASRTGLWATLAVAAAVLAALVWWRWPQPAPPQAEAPAPVAGAVQVASAPAPTSLVEHPIAAASAPPMTPLQPDTPDVDRVVQGEVEQLVGRERALRVLQLDGFVRRLVATIDNLDRSHAPAAVWPANPTPGRFSVLGRDDGQAVNPDNALRYAPFVHLVESVDAQAAVALYVRAYALFQQAYEELGYPGRHLNDRLVAVIDHLLRTPEPPEPLRVTLTEIKGPIPSARPWVHYAFADPELEARSAGQKLLMRMGNVNQRRIKAKLGEVRALLSKTPPRQ